MIGSFKSKALKLYWQKGNASRLRPDWVVKVRLALNILDAASHLDGIAAAGFGFHPLTGDMAGRYALTISRNWRMTFAWEGEYALDIDLEDYHGR